jgi:hypothetical protein
MLDWIFDTIFELLIAKDCVCQIETLIAFRAQAILLATLIADGLPTGVPAFFVAAVLRDAIAGLGCPWMELADRGFCEPDSTGAHGISVAPNLLDFKTLDYSLAREHILDKPIHVLSRRWRALEPVRGRLIDFVKLHRAALAELDRQGLSLLVKQYLSDIRRGREANIFLRHIG